MKTRLALACFCGMAFALVSAPARAADVKSIALVDAGYAAPCNVEGIRAQVEHYLNVPVTLRTIKTPKGDRTEKEWYDALQKTRTSNDVLVIGLVAVTNLTTHQGFVPQIATGIVNVPALRTNDTVAFEKRILRLVMRDAAFLAGLSPSLDPLCVTRQYKTLADLDNLGMNYFPPYQITFAKNAASLGLKPVHDFKAEMLKRRAAKPPAPPAPPTPPAK